jgi:hypothetical protein
MAPEAQLPRFAAPIAALCGILAGIGVTLPWYYYVNMGDEPPVPMRGIEGEFLGRYTLVLSLVGAIAALVCAVLRSQSRCSKRGPVAWAMSAVTALALASLVTLVDWIGHGIRNWHDEQRGLSTNWFGIGVGVTLWAAVAGAVSATRLLVEVRRSSGEVPPAPAPVRAP